MSNLAAQKPKDTYQRLLQLPSWTDGSTATQFQLGDGTPVPLYLSATTLRVGSTGADGVVQVWSQADSAYVSLGAGGGGGGGGTWGSITGTLSAQTDLATALGGYLPLTGGTLSGTLRLDTITDLTGTTSLTFFDDECVFNGTVIATTFIGDHSGFGSALTGLNANAITAGSITGTGAMVRASAVGARYAGFIASPTATDYVLDPFTATSTSRLTIPAISLGAGTLTAQIRVDGVAVTGWDAIAVTTSPQSVTLGSAVTWAAGAEVVLRLSSISGATGFRFSIPSEV